ncbi:MAG: DEAD/DEAH box helicase [Candidatus Coatesbacteria bacterium]
MNPPASTPPSGFSGLGIAPVYLEALTRLRITTPTPIQRQAIPVALEGKDVAGIAQTGTGKTIAYGIPMMQRLAASQGLGLVVLPTRELAMQVDEALRRMNSGLRTAVIIGGAGIGAQLDAIRRGPQIVVATPGRLNDHLQQRTIRLDGVHVVVLDEADRMLDMGFAPQIDRIFQNLPKDRQTLLFSATIPDGIMRMASKYMRAPIRVEVAPTGTTAAGVTQELFVLRKEERNRLLDKLLQQYPGTTLIFSRTKHGAKRLVQVIRNMGHTAAELHANRSMSQRRDALEGFKAGKYRVLVATDIASRGIDVTGIGLVLNYDLPDNPEDYVHRIGRTARAGAGGHAISFVAPEQRGDVRHIERLIRKSLLVSPLPELPPERRPPPYVAPYVDPRARAFPRQGFGPRPGGRPGGRPSAPGAPRTFGAPNASSAGPRRPFSGPPPRRRW